MLGWFVNNYLINDNNAGIRLVWPCSRHVILSLVKTCIHTHACMHTYMHIHTVYLHIPCLHAYLQQIHACMHAYLHIYIIIIIIRQLLCPVVGQRPQHSVSKLPCLVLSSAISCRSSICPCRLSTAWLVSLVVFSCHMVSKWWYARSIGRLWGGWYALPRTISFFSQCWLYLWPLSSPWHRCWSFYLCMWCWAYFFPFWSVRPLVCSVLVCSVSRSLHHMS